MDSEGAILFIVGAPLLSFFHKFYTDADMGYGPPVQSINKVGVVRDKLGGVTGNQSGFHPHAPPITTPDGTSTQAGDTVVNFDSNFIMMKKSDTNEDIKQV